MDMTNAEPTNERNAVGISTDTQVVWFPPLSHVQRQRIGRVGRELQLCRTSHPEDRYIISADALRCLLIMQMPVRSAVQPDSTNAIETAPKQACNNGPSSVSSTQQIESTETRTDP